MHGKGHLECRSKNDGYVYEGEFEMGKFNGRGHLKKGNFVYDGEFKNDYRHGKGQEITWTMGTPLKPDN